MDNDFTSLLSKCVQDIMHTQQKITIKLELVNELEKMVISINEEIIELKKHVRELNDNKQKLLKSI